MKKVLSLFLSIFLLFSIVIVEDYYSFAKTYTKKCGDNMTYEVNTVEGTIVFNGYGDMYNMNTHIDYYSTIKNVVINEGITSIGANVFNDCINLEKIDIAGTVKKIGYNAFGNCRSLQSIDLPNSIEDMSGAFYNCTGLQKVVLENGVKIISEHAFENCINLTELIMPNSITRIDYSAFNGCSKLESINIPNSVKAIESYAFSYSALKSVSIPNSVTELGSAFSNCKQLKEVVMTKNIKEMGDTQYSGIFENCCSLTNIDIPEGVSEILPYSFSNCTSLAFVNLPNSIKKIGQNAFKNCESLNYINLNDGLEKIDVYGFADSGLVEMNIPDSVTTMDSAFRDCKKLRKIHIGEKVSSLSGMLYGCSNLSNITVDENNSRYYTINNVLFDNDNNYNTGGLKLEKYPPKLKEKSYIVPDNVEEIADYAFESCDFLENIEFSSDSELRYIGYSAFYQSQNIETISLPKNLRYLYGDAFNGCVSLERLIIDCSNLSFIGTNAFSQCSALKDVYFSGSEYDWKEIKIYDGNDCLTNANLHFSKYIDLVTQHLILADLAYKNLKTNQSIGELFKNYNGKKIFTDSSVTTAGLYKSYAIQDFVVEKVLNDPQTDFYGAVLKNDTTKQIVFVFRGSKEFNDFVTDAKFTVLNELDGQFDSALKLYENFVELNEYYINDGYTVTFTGHSLGGALASDMAVKTGYQCYSFNGACGHTVHLSYYENWLNASKIFTGVSEIPITNYAVSSSESSENTVTDTVSNMIQNTNSDLFHTKNYALNMNLKNPNVCYKHDIYAMVSPSSSDTIKMNEIISQNAPKSDWNMNIDLKNIGTAYWGLGRVIGSMFIKGSVHLGTTSGDVISTSSMNTLLQYTRVIYGGDGDDQLFGGFGNDVLVSGNGNDTLMGNFGDDVYCLTDNSATVTINDTIGNDIAFIPNYSNTLDSSQIKYVSSSSNYATYKIGKLTIRLQKNSKGNHKLTFCDVNGGEVFSIDSNGNIKGFSRFSIARFDSKISTQQSNYAIVLNGLLTVDICDCDGNIVDTVTNIDMDSFEGLVRNYGYIELYNDDDPMIVLYFTDDSYSVKVKGDSQLDVAAGTYDENSKLCSANEVIIDDINNEVKISFENNQVKITQNENIIESNETIYAKTIDVESSKIELLENETTLVEYKVYPSNADNSSIECYSENPNIATVDDDGNITAVSAGETKIHVYDKTNAVSDYVIVNVSHTFDNHICTICGKTDLEFNYPMIKIDNLTNVNIEDEGEYSYFYFIPDQSGNYSVESFGDYDTYGYLFDENMNELESNDDGCYDGNFRLDAELEAGEVYIIGCRMYDTSETGTFSVEIKKHCHKYTSNVYKPTCLIKGYTIYTCECGDSYIDKYVNATGHSYNSGKVTKVATCTATGVKTYTCTVCGATKTETLDKKSHTYKTTTTKATTSKNGSVVTKCTACGTVKIKSTIYYPKTVTLSATSYTYDGKVKKPTLKVVGSNGKTISSANYTVSYASGRNNVGKYSVKVTFKGNYSGTKTLYFTINSKGTSISSVSAKSKGFTVKWKKQATQTTGYQIQYSTSSKFTNAKTVTVGKNSTTSKTISKLSAKKKYYIRIRTYKTVGKAKYYSAWSKAKTVTTKK